MKRGLLVLLAVLIVVPAAALIAGHFVLNSEWLRARAEASVERATGRALTIKGKVRLAWALTPSIEAEDVSLANPPGMSRPEMVHFGRVEARIALLPLLSRRVELRRLVLADPDLLLERDAQGKPNWDFTRPAAPQSATTSAPSAAPRFAFELGAVEVEHANIAWHGGGAPLRLTATRLAYAPANGGVAGQLAVNGVPVALAGKAGPVVGGDWPLDLRLTGAGVEATVAGTVENAALGVRAASLAGLEPLAGRRLPAVQDVQASGVWSRTGLTDLRLTAGAADLGGGLRLVRFGATAPTLEQKATIAAELAAGQLPITVNAAAGSFAALLGRGPIPFEIAAAANDATASAVGSVADLRGDGLDLSLTAKVPDVRRLGALAGYRLPSLHDVDLQTRVALVPAGLALRGLRMTMLQGDVGGDVVAGLSPRPFLRGTLVSQRVDLDVRAPKPPPAAAPASTAAQAPAAPPGPPPPRPALLISDKKLPFAALRRADADLNISIGELVWRGIASHAIQTRLHLQDGQLRLDPVSLQGPGGSLQARFAADATAEPPTAALWAAAPGLAAGPLVAALGAPGSNSGTIDLDLDLHGRGGSLHALAATLDGYAGAAMVDGQIENRWLANLLAQTLREANLPIDPGGVSAVRCAALRAEASNGEVRLSALTIDTSKLKLEGQGGFNLGNETIELHLRPQLRVGALLAVPVRVSGTLRSPKAALDPGALALGRVGIVIGGAAPPDTCGPALSVARAGHPGAPPPPPEPERKVKASDLLRSLLR